MHIDATERPLSASQGTRMLLRWTGCDVLMPRVDEGIDLAHTVLGAVRSYHDVVDQAPSLHGEAEEAREYARAQVVEADEFLGTVEENRDFTQELCDESASLPPVLIRCAAASLAVFFGRVIFFAYHHSHFTCCTAVWHYEWQLAESRAARDGVEISGTEKAPVKPSTLRARV